MGICCGKNDEIVEEKVVSNKFCDENLEEIKLTESNPTIFKDDEYEDESKNELKLINENIPSDKLLINELKLKFPDGLEDLKRRLIRTSFRSSFNSKRNTQNNLTIKHLHEDLIDNLTILEDKLRGTQKIIVNNTELSMMNILEQFKFDLAMIETSLHPEVIDKRREVYCKLKACIYLAKENSPKNNLREFEKINPASDTKEINELTKKLSDIERFIEENKDVYESQKEIEAILDNLENINGCEEDGLKMMLKEKSIFLIKVCILRNY